MHFCCFKPEPNDGRTLIAAVRVLSDSRRADRHLEGYLRRP